MASNSKIEWTEATWNPVAGCTVLSPGCTNCYAMKMADRIQRMSPKLGHYAGTTQPSKAGPVWTGKLALPFGLAWILFCVFGVIGAWINVWMLSIRDWWKGKPSEDHH